ncbi:2-O-methyltransferase NoeI [Luteitalea pratensis]|uniref:2-O-methyltransferase NoeI n=1 Tax=Luteitalea pratensis TaxID=1855912 RepID=A0A143PY55_LUTPR|nr:FkbM family methyltransferase [Luteitalea pratensis]AMY12970.1 2-O-methyltransferase NoeI [Luteitalea pratensis]
MFGFGSKLRSLVRRVTNAPDQNTRYDEETRAVIHRVCTPDATCIDVGCHRGELLDVMLAAAPRGRHYGFEPLPDYYDDLRHRYDETGLARILNVALSNIKGVATFNYVTSNPAYSGLRQRRYPQEETVAAIDVKTDLLDNLLPAHQRVDLIKIDVEGAELQVLEGAVRTLHRNRPVVVFEHGLGAADCYGTRPEQVYDLLTKEAGLAVSLMASWLNSEHPLTRDDFAREFDKSRNYYFIAYGK